MRGGGYGFDACERPAGLRAKNGEALAEGFVGVRVTLDVGM